MAPSHLAFTPGASFFPTPVWQIKKAQACARLKNALGYLKSEEKDLCFNYVKILSILLQYLFGTFYCE